MTSAYQRLINRCSLLDSSLSWDKFQSSIDDEKESLITQCQTILARSSTFSHRLSDYIVMACLGEGSYGVVCDVLWKGQHYAMKRQRIDEETGLSDKVYLKLIFYHD